ncbi:ABC-2 family transporter protein [Cupriavidus necator]|uniref:Hypothetical membrane associated protein n=1 Tax=Cupriavidus necator (strain ATCC 17699 / DSM 428 / KCTC 22496 / NCIMB 10442 / H16 / Stanier 337) TaxID=381666 RepID=Q0K2A9_CUPNH|nr:hypothetical protein C265_17879 [Cupriavidus sp. GA3-3]KUE89312.1 hypothetical protein ASL20_08410 [Cupriavidus necator]CAJ95865.1 hypothetical membrane associated protein [Cupriavidus necator H16]
MVAVWALFDRFGDVQGWRIGEVALFYGLVNCMFAIADAIGRGFDVLGRPFCVPANSTGFVFLLAAIGAWRTGLRHYTSTGS